MNEIGRRILQKRLECGLSQEELAKYAGISRQTMCRYETGVIESIPSDKIEKIAARLGVTPAFLMGWDEDTRVSENDPATEEDLQMLKDNPDLRILLSAGAKLKKSDIEFLVQMARRMDEE